MLRSSADHDRIDPTGNRLQVAIASVAFDLVCVRVDREDLVTTLAKPLVHDVAAVILRIPGNSGHRDPPVGEELRGSLLDCRHDVSFLPAADHRRADSRALAFGIHAAGYGGATVGANGPLQPGRMPLAEGDLAYPRWAKTRGWRRYGTTDRPGPEHGVAG